MRCCTHPRLICIATLLWPPARPLVRVPCRNKLPVPLPLVQAPLVPFPPRLGGQHLLRTWWMLTRVRGVLSLRQLAQVPRPRRNPQRDPRRRSLSRTSKERRGLFLLCRPTSSTTTRRLSRSTTRPGPLTAKARAALTPLDLLPPTLVPLLVRRWRHRRRARRFPVVSRAHRPRPSAGEARCRRERR